MIVAVPPGARHGRHEAHPAVEVAIRHGVGAGLYGIARRGAAPFDMEGRIGEDVIEGLGSSAERGDVAQGARHVGLDHAHALGKVVALDVAARQPGEAGVALDHA